MKGVRYDNYLYHRSLVWALGKEMQERVSEGERERFCMWCVCLGDIHTAFINFFLSFSCSVMSDSATPWIAACQASLSFTIAQSLLRLVSVVLVMPSNHLILCCPLLLLSLIVPSFFLMSPKSQSPMVVFLCLLRGPV